LSPLKKRAQDGARGPPSSWRCSPKRDFVLPSFTFSSAFPCRFFFFFLAHRGQNLSCKPCNQWPAGCFARYRAAVMHCDCSDGEKQNEQYHDAPRAAHICHCAHGRRSRHPLHCVERNCIGCLGGADLRWAWTALLRRSLPVPPPMPIRTAGLSAHLLHPLVSSHGHLRYPMLRNW
jgi:hypothetical protein